MIRSPATVCWRMSARSPSLSTAEAARSRTPLVAAGQQRAELVAPHPVDAGRNGEAARSADASRCNSASRRRGRSCSL